MAESAMHRSGSVRRTPQATDDGTKASSTMPTRTRSVKLRDSIDLAKQSHPPRPTPLSVMPVTDKPWPSPPPEQTKPRHRAYMLAPAGTRAPSPVAARKFSIRRKARTPNEGAQDAAPPHRNVSIRREKRDQEKRDQESRSSSGSSSSQKEVHASTKKSGKQAHLDSGAESNMEHDSTLKSARWNLLGGLFGKKAVTSPGVTPPQTPPAVVPVTERSRNSAGSKSNLAPPQPPSPEPPRGLFRSRSRAKAARHREDDKKPDFKRANTAPVQAGNISKPLPVPGMRPGMQRNPTHPSRLLLDVEIPDVQMERYSVMFGQVLEHNSCTPDWLAGSRGGLSKLPEKDGAVARIVSGDDGPDRGSHTSDRNRAGMTIASGRQEMVHPT